ncbi:DctP family TRAP transporter solute receptor [Propionibacterium sp. oral taxon 192 str. F0372]|uniref:TRAP transporter substrate-binding protein n=1 Tax=Propionibacterium sp. oral taxon 192 TaxID=671222 RepID=UPI000353BB91|nr:TRAP transporter substrate-binding protein [Propionibacterium sp. oral taxon 192]EPH06284.1 DctP family TRAP transporter solute receptor [Propionibacterium sp. oral taxon 192 str. F0372]
MKISKIVTTAAVSLLSLSLAACGGGAGSGGGAKTIFKLAFNQTEQHPQYTAGVEFGKKLEEATQGRYTVKVYANEQLGGQADVIQNLSNGSVEMMWVGGPVMESYNPDFVVYNLPYMFDSVESFRATMADLDAMKELYTSIEESKSITVLAGVYAGSRNVYNSKRPINTPADLNGLKIRVQQSDSQVKMIEAMGAVASPMNNGEVYSALQTGVIDGAENNEPTWDALKQSEVAKYYSYTQHLMIPDYLLVSTKVLNAMSEEDQEAFKKIVPEIQAMASDGFQAFTESSIEHATSIGAQFNQVEDKQAFKDLVQPLVDESINANETRKALAETITANNAAHPAK